VLLDPWLAQWHEHIPGLTLQNFNLEREETIEPDSTGTLENERLADFPIQVASPDGTRTLAVSSGVEPDSQVLLIDEDNNFERLLFCGTPCSWGTGGWIDNDRFYVAGSEERDPLGETISPVFHLFDLEIGTRTTSYGPVVPRE